jgi:hypothetical protein
MCDLRDKAFPAGSASTPRRAHRREASGRTCHRTTARVTSPPTTASACCRVDVRNATRMPSWSHSTEGTATAPGMWGRHDKVTPALRPLRAIQAGAASPATRGRSTRATAVAHGACTLSEAARSTAGRRFATVNAQVRAPRGCSSMVEHQLPKLTVRVRFSSPALRAAQPSTSAAARRPDVMARRPCSRAGRSPSRCPPSATGRSAPRSPRGPASANPGRAVHLPAAAPHLVAVRVELRSRRAPARRGSCRPGRAVRSSRRPPSGGRSGSPGRGRSRGRAVPRRARHPRHPPRRP